MLAINVVFFVLTWIIMMLRVYTRAYLIKSFGRDDWSMLAALLLFTGYLICQLGGVAYGTGRHDEDLTALDRMRALRYVVHTPPALPLTDSLNRYWWWCELFYTAATCMLKCSVVSKTSLGQHLEIANLTSLNIRACSFSVSP